MTNPIGFLEDCSDHTKNGGSGGHLIKECVVQKRSSELGGNSTDSSRHVTVCLERNFRTVSIAPPTLT